MATGAPAHTSGADGDYDVYTGGRDVSRFFRAEDGHLAETQDVRIVSHERRPPGPHRGFGRTATMRWWGQREMGARATMNRQDGQVGQTVASRILKRSVVLFGHKTSVSLEEPFWQALREIATERGITTGALLNSIASKRVEGNLSSALRVAVLEHFRAARPGVL
jgi:predicted DNA-binding ribbon-helix-helix protein